jgi:hypothetical protein
LNLPPHGQLKVLTVQDVWMKGIQNNFFPQELVIHTSSLCATNMVDLILFTLKHERVSH